MILRNLYYSWWKFSLIILKDWAGTALFDGAIKHEFSEQHKHLRTKKAPYSVQICTFLIQIKCKFNAHFDWE